MNYTSLRKKAQRKRMRLFRDCFNWRTATCVCLLCELRGVCGGLGSNKMAAQRTRLLLKTRINMNRRGEEKEAKDWYL